MSTARLRAATVGIVHSVAGGRTHVQATAGTTLAGVAAMTTLSGIFRRTSVRAAACGEQRREPAADLDREPASSHTLRQRLRRERAQVVNDPLARTALPLLINIGSNGVLGVAYWMVAARLYDTRTVATNAAIIAAMTTISGITQLNLNQTLPVLVPRDRVHARRIIGRVYGAVTAFALLVLAAFTFLVLPHMTVLSAALSDKTHLALFVAGVLIFNLFALQDAALISLRRQQLIPFENAVFGALKLLLLFPLLALAPGLGIYVSWVIPLVLLVPAISLVIFRRRQQEAAVTSLPVVTNGLGTLALDYLGYLFLIGATFFLPVVGLELLPTVGAAVFAIGWQTSSTIDLLASNVGAALTVETSYGGDPTALRRTAVRHGLLLVSGVAIVGALAAPWILSLYGPQYRTDGVLMLRLLLLAGIPRCLATFAIAEARAHREVGFIVRLRAQNFAVALGLAVLLTPKLGVTGMGLAWLGAQVLSGCTAQRRLLRWSPSRVEVGVSP